MKALFGELDREPIAVFSDDARFRYLLIWPTGLQSDRKIAFCGANPSKAGSRDDTGRVRSDATISRLVNLGRTLGYGEIWMTNVRAFVATDPANVPTDPEAIGGDFNTECIKRALANCELFVCCWGHLAGSRGAEVLAMVRAADKMPHALALTADGTPRHPRGVPGTARPFPLPWMTVPEAQRTAELRSNPEASP